MQSFRRCALLLLSALLVGRCAGQTPASVTPPEPPASNAGVPADSPNPGAEAPNRHIVIQSHGEPPPISEEARPQTSTSAPKREPSPDATPDVSDLERGALTVTAYDLDARVNRARGGLAMRAALTVRNDSTTPLRQLPLEISSSLHWESATLLEASRRTPLTLAQHQIDTDADHTGAATEIVLTLPTPLAPGALASLDLFYSGTVPRNGDRLARLGANAQQQQATDWDEIAPEWTGLRGFGNVLWYPVASAQLFMGDGNSLFTAVGRMRRREEDAMVRLRLSVEYEGEPPAAAYLCGHRAALKAVPDDPAAPTATGSGIASAEFPAEPLGFRLLSLFVLQQPEIRLGGSEPGENAAIQASTPAVSSSNPDEAASPKVPALLPRPVPSGPQTGEPILALVSPNPDSAAGLGPAADAAAALLKEWMGPRPLSALTVLDHPGQPFQDGPLLVAPAATLETPPERPALVYSLTHAWIQTGQPWMDEGLAQFFALLWVERQSGRAAALDQLNGLLQPVALAEPNLTSAADDPPGQPLITATDELFYRRKGAAVWWMLRDLAGPDALRTALTAWRTQLESTDKPEARAVAFEHLLEQSSGKDLGWFFHDWVLKDRGLPDLSIADVQVSPMAAGAGHSSGYLAAITVRNAGGAAADVPLRIASGPSGQVSTTERIRVPGFSQVTQRVLVQQAPTSVTLNDGSTPELSASTHTRVLAAQKPVAE